MNLFIEMSLIAILGVIVGSIVTLIVVFQVKRYEVKLQEGNQAQNVLAMYCMFRDKCKKCPFEKFCGQELHEENYNVYLTLERKVK